MSEIALMVRLYRSWGLTEIKALTRRERRYWIELGLWNVTT